MTHRPVLVTGSEGLIGRHVIERLEARGTRVRLFDLRGPEPADLRNVQDLRDAARGVSGVLHLGGVSRVVWGQRDPENCTLVNAGATERLLRICLDEPDPPWFVFGSSREVYGQAARFPVPESAPYAPLNVYARSKVNAERSCHAAREAGLRVGVCRFSSVYGDVVDHHDRVAPAFARAAAQGGTIRTEGASNMLDFTHVDDIARGMLTLLDAVASGEALPPIHFVSGAGISLGSLAALSEKLAKSPLDIVEAAPRDYDVSRFVGDPARAAELLSWTATTPLEVGYARLVRDFAALADLGGTVGQPRPAGAASPSLDSA